MGPWRFFEHFETEKIFAENVTKKKDFGWTALHWAVRSKEFEIAEALIEAGVDLDAKDQFGLTALHLSVIYTDLKFGKLLIEAGARLNIKSRSNETALDFAVRGNHHEFAEMLQKNPNKKKFKTIINSENQKFYAHWLQQFILDVS